MSVVSLSKMILAASGAQSSLTSKLLSVLAEIWGGFDGWYDDDGVEQAALLAADAEVAVLKKIRAVGDSAARQSLAQVGVTSKADALGEFVHPRAVDLAELWARPAEQYRYAVSVGDNEADALLKALERATHIAEMDAALVNRDAQIARFRRHEKVIGFRRILHPELADSKLSCGLCVAAATRKYSVDELLPLHQGCNCTVAPITRSNDPGLDLNQKDLDRIYAAGGGTDKQNLSKVRVATVENGELGPLLVQSGSKVIDENEARERSSKRRVKKKEIDKNSLTYIRNKPDRTYEDSKRLHALAEMQYENYANKIKDLRSSGVTADDPRVMGMIFARKRAERDVKKYAKEMAVAA